MGRARALRTDEPADEIQQPPVVLINEVPPCVRVAAPALYSQQLIEKILRGCAQAAFRLRNPLNSR